MARAKEWGLESGAPTDFERFWSNYTSWLRFRDLGVEPDRCRELIEAQGDYSFSAIFRAVLYAYGEKVGKGRIGEKSPSHSQYLPYLLDWFPDARILVTQRDPRAVIASQIKTYYVQKELTPRSIRQGIFIKKREQEIIHWAKEWVADFEERLKPWENDPRFHTVVYEKLVQNVEAEVRDIFAFLEEPFEPSVLTDRNDVTVPLPAAKNKDSEWEQWRTEHNAKTLQDISTDSLDKWKLQLSTRDVALIEGCCAPTMDALGYAQMSSRPLRLAGRGAAVALAASGDAEMRLREVALKNRSRLSALRKGLRTSSIKIAAGAVARGAPPALFDYRHVTRETVQEFFVRHGAADGKASYETVHPEAVAVNALPCNVKSRDELPDDRGWWGYSFRDVPRRTSGETFIATLPGCLITSYRDPQKADDFYPAILTHDFHALDMREIRFRPRHAATLGKSLRPPVRLKKATWITERVYHNHSHWLTAHLPKLLLLRERGMLADVLLPLERSSAIDDSLRLVGLDPADFRSYDPGRPLIVDALTVLGTDRFRPELLQMIPRAFGVMAERLPRKKVFISRVEATRRRLLNEEEIWSLLEPHGFERVRMETLSFAAQVDLMRETAVLVAPHGAGLTNMLYCPRGAHIVEIADLSFPNPNFYAVASAMSHHYWIAPAKSLGDLHPLEKDLHVEPEVLDDILRRLADSEQFLDMARA